MKITFDLLDRAACIKVLELIGREWDVLPGQTTESSVPQQTNSEPNPTEEPKHNLADLRRLTKEVITADKSRKPAVKKLLAEMGADSVSDLSEDKYDDYADALQSLSA